MGRVFGLDQQLFFDVLWQIIAVVLLFGVLTKILWKPVKQVLTERTLWIKQDFEKAKESLEEGKAQKQSYYKLEKELKRSQEQILKEAKKKGEQIKEHLLQEAKEEMEKEKQDMIEEGRRQELQLKRQMQDYTAKLAIIMAQKIMEEELSEQKKKAYTEQMLTKLEEMTWTKS